MDGNRLFLVNVRLKRLNTDYVYKKEETVTKKKLLLTKTVVNPEGFYYKNGSRCPLEEIHQRYLLIEGEEVFYKPYVTLEFRLGGNKTNSRGQYFDTDEEALTWAQEQADKGIKIQIQITN